MRTNLVISAILVAVCFGQISAKKPKEKPDWAKKDLRDYSDADLERLYEQWEEDDEPIPLDELPDGDPRKPQPTVDFSKLDMSDPEAVVRATKKGKTLMMFVRVGDNPTREETEEISSIWQTGLWNSHIQADRFMLEDDRVIFMFKDGDVAFEARDYFLEQERCEDVQLEQETYCGKYSKVCEQEQEERKKKEAKDKADMDKARKAMDKKLKEDQKKNEKEEKKAKKDKKKKKDEL